MAEQSPAPPRPLADLLMEAAAEDHRKAENHGFQRALVRGEVRQSALAAFLEPPR